MAAKQQDIKNVVLVGQGGVGKTMVAEAMLHLTGKTSRLGGHAGTKPTLDYDTQETARGFSISTTMAPIEWEGTRINMLDAPCYPDFVGDAFDVVDCARRNAQARVRRRAERQGRIVDCKRGDFFVEAQRAVFEVGNARDRARAQAESNFGVARDREALAALLEREVAFFVRVECRRAAVSNNRNFAADFADFGDFFACRRDRDCAVARNLNRICVDRDF